MSDPNLTVASRISRIELLWLPIVIAGLLLVYLPGLGNSPVFDDDLLASGELFALYESLLPLRERLLSYGSFVWLQALFGEGWWKQRLVNLAIHLAVVMALWALYREILRSIAPPESEGGPQEEALPYHRSPALGVAIGFFALNPVAVYAVAYLIQRSILMATLFVVLGLWLFVLGISRGRVIYHALALVAYLLALASKEYAIFAALAALPLYIVVSRPGLKRLAIVAAAGAVLVGAAGAALLVRYGEIIGKPFDEYSRIYLAQLAALSPDAEGNAYGLSILNQAYLFFHYGLRWFVPWEGWMSINLRPVFPVSWLTFPHALGGVGYAAVVAGGFYLVTRFRDWRSLVGLSILIPALLFATEFLTVWVQDPFVLYRSYLWAVGVPGLVFILLHGAPIRVLASIASVVGVLFIWQALDRVVSLQDPEKAWSDAIAKLPDDPRSVGRWFPYLNRGSARAERNAFNLALLDFESSSALGDLGMGSFNAGSILAATGEHSRALAAFDRAEKEGYKLYSLPFQRAQSLMAVGKPAEAYAQLQAARSMNPPSPVRELVLLNAGRAALQLGRRPEAIRWLEEILVHEPRHREGRYTLAMALISDGKAERGLEIADALLEEKPDASAYYARALAHYGLGRKSEAKADIDNAVRLAPRNSNLREWQAKIERTP